MGTHDLHCFHGRGVGRALTTALIADAREAGIEVLILDARGDNTRALHLYRSLGVTRYGRLPDFVAVGEHRYNKVFYMMDLRRRSWSATVQERWAQGIQRGESCPGPG
jgi:ribosomal protein S18 acetylase RimI-like enzyme